MHNGRIRAAVATLALAAAAAPALAQPPGPPPAYAPQTSAPQDYPPQTYPGAAGDRGRPGEVAPPPGYRPEDSRDDASAQAREEDRRYSYEAERWAAENCVAQRANNTAAGAVIGGILGALVGSGLSSRHDSGAGIIAGAGLGAIAGGAIGGSAANNPNCPPGYGLRSGAAPFGGAPIYGDVVYVAPPDYNPWFWYGGRWTYRPYPYHRYWYRHEYRR